MGSYEGLLFDDHCDDGSLDASIDREASTDLDSWVERERRHACA